MTWSTAGISSPRAAMSVANRMAFGVDLNLFFFRRVVEKVILCEREETVGTDQGFSVVVSAAIASVADRLSAGALPSGATICVFRRWRRGTPVSGRGIGVGNNTDRHPVHCKAFKANSCYCGN